MESTEVSNVPVNNRNVCKSNIGDDKDATIIKDAKGGNIIIENLEGKQVYYTYYSYHTIIYLFNLISYYHYVTF